MTGIKPSFPLILIQSELYYNPNCLTLNLQAQDLSLNPTNQSGRDLESNRDGLSEGIDGVLLERGEELVDEHGGTDAHVEAPRLIILVRDLMKQKLFGNFN